MTRLLALISTLFFIVIQSSGQEIIRGPYQQLNTPNSIILRWRTDIPTDSWLWYGDSPTNLTTSISEAGDRLDHEINKLPKAILSALPS